MADPFAAENDAEWSQWFAALRDDQKAKVIKAVTGESNDFSLRDGATGQNSNITHLPHRFFNESRGLTKLNLYKCTSLAALPESFGQLQALTELNLVGCSSLAALPESLGQLQALTELYLHNCSSLADESKDLARRLLQCNEKIRDGPSGSPERFHMTTYDFAATILFGSSSRYGAGAAAASGQVGGGDGGGGGGVGDGNDEAENDSPPRRRPRAAASEGCILGKINELGEDGGASDFKKNMADFCGVSFKGAFEGWAQELKEKFDLVRESGSGS